MSACVSQNLVTLTVSNALSDSTVPTNFVYTVASEGHSPDAFATIESKVKATVTASGIAATWVNSESLHDIASPVFEFELLHLETFSCINLNFFTPEGIVWNTHYDWSGGATDTELLQKLPLLLTIYEMEFSAKQP